MTAQCFGCAVVGHTLRKICNCSIYSKQKCTDYARICDTEIAEKMIFLFSILLSNRC